QWFERFIDAELARFADTSAARRIDVPAPKLTVVDLIPKVDELPRGFVLDPSSVYVEATNGRRGLVPTGAGEVVELLFKERDTARVTIGEGARAYPEWRDTVRAQIRANLLNDKKPGELLQAGRFFATIQGGICTLDGLAELRTLIESKLLDASGESEVAR